MFNYPREGEGYVLLGRMEGGVPGYLSYSVREGEVICLFESALEAEQFYMRWRAGIPGKGWGTVRLEIGELIKVLLNFDLVSLNPRPDPGASEYLYTAEDFVRGCGIQARCVFEPVGAPNRPPEPVLRHALAPPLRQAG